MKTPTGKNYSRDESGQWWYVNKQGLRTRCHVHRCAKCGDEYVVSVYHYRTSEFCSRRCARTSRLEELDTYPKAKRVIGLAAEKAPRWKGGKTRRHGYIMVFSPDHPSLGPHTSRKYVAEHRLVMEEKLGRPLLPNERVHHKNGIKTDNRPENLELWEFGHPAGQRVNERELSIAVPVSLLLSLLSKLS